MSYQMYVRPHLDFGDVIYHNQRANLMNLLEQVQYNAAPVPPPPPPPSDICSTWLLARYNTRLPL